MIRDGFIRVAASTPEVKVADVEYNREKVCEQIEEGRKKGASIMVFPELVLTGYTCGELFIQKSLLAKAKAKKVLSARVKSLKTAGEQQCSRRRASVSKAGRSG